VLESSPILEIENLKTHFFLEKSTARAADGVNLCLPRKSTLGVVGESEKQATPLPFFGCWAERLPLLIRALKTKLLAPAASLTP
jgi:hypothetical protein